MRAQKCFAWLTAFVKKVFREKPSGQFVKSILDVAEFPVKMVQTIHAFPKVLNFRLQEVFDT
jgi:hypothetical protein